MKILVVGDVHWCQYSSIWRSRNPIYSSRLDNLICSVNWAEELAVHSGCSSIIYLGDFFDSNHLNAEEISALQHIHWASISHIFLTGNHEISMTSLEYSTAELFNLCPNARVISTPEQYVISDEACELCFLPYVADSNRQYMQTYFGAPQLRRIIFSHNDLKGVDYGNFISPEGYDLVDIETMCDLFLNGHIHHKSQVTPKIFNIGNLTGQNFTESSAYSHGAGILDTDTLTIDFIENPYAVYFDKLDLSSITDEQVFRNILHALTKCHILTIKVTDTFFSRAKVLIGEIPRTKILEYRLITERSTLPDATVAMSFEPVDHLKQFRDYILMTMGANELIYEELSNVLR